MCGEIVIVILWRTKDTAKLTTRTLRRISKQNWNAGKRRSNRLIWSFFSFL